jgi:hypothetical protein
LEGTSLPLPNPAGVSSRIGPSGWRGVMLTKVAWGTVPDWIMTISIVLALITLAQQRRHAREERRVSACKRARRVRVSHAIAGRQEIDGQERFIVDAHLDYTIVNHSDTPIYEPIVTVVDDFFDPPRLNKPIEDRSHDFAVVSSDGGMVQGRIALPGVRLPQDDAEELCVNVSFEDIDFYRWEYSSPLRTIRDKPLYDPLSHGKLWWWYRIHFLPAARRVLKRLRG